jgi:hypothetical protein
MYFLSKTQVTTLLHKLEKEGEIINVPLNAVDDNHFTAFGRFILKELKGVNYLFLFQPISQTQGFAGEPEKPVKVTCFKQKK